MPHFGLSRSIVPLQSARHDLLKRHSPTTNVSSQRKPGAVMRLFSQGLNQELKEWPRRCYIHGPSRFEDLLPFSVCLYHATIPGQPHVERPVEVDNNAFDHDHIIGVDVVSGVDDGCRRWGVEAASSIYFVAEGERTAAGEGSKARVRRLVYKDTGRLARDTLLEFSSVGNTNMDNV
jgi:hypothetical protein